MGLTIIGTIGSILLALCAMPLAIEAIKNKTISINIWFLMCWTLGELFTLAYVLINKDYPLILNYSCNIILLIPVWYYKDKR